MHGCEVTVDVVEQMWPGIFIRQVLFIIEEEQHPPVISSSIHLSTTIHSDMSAVPERNKVFVIRRYLGLSRPMPNILRGNQLPHDLDCDIVGMLHANGHRIILFGRNTHYALSLRYVGSPDGREYGLLSLELVIDCIRVRHSPVLVDIEDTAATDD